jgi:hypothetical protein
MDYGRPENDKEHVLSNSFLVPENCIFVGSQMLSRGLTIEGLCTSYYPKAVTLETQDTSQQCCRWYGHRPNYSDLVSIFVQQRQAELFRCLTISENMLRQDIKAYILAVLVDTTPPVLALRTASNFSRGISLFRPAGPSRIHHRIEKPLGEGDGFTPEFTLPLSKEACDATDTLYELAFANSAISTDCFGASTVDPSCEVYCNMSNADVADYLKGCRLPADVCTHIRYNENPVNVAFLVDDGPSLFKAGSRHNSFRNRNALLDVPIQRGNFGEEVVAEEARAWFKFKPLGRGQLMNQPDEAEDFDYSRPFTLNREQDAPTLITILRRRGYERASPAIPYQVELLISMSSSMAYLPPDVVEEDKEEEGEVIDDGDYMYVAAANSHRASYLLGEFALDEEETVYTKIMMTSASRDMLLQMFAEMREEGNATLVFFLGRTVTLENEAEIAWVGYLESLKEHGTRPVSIDSMCEGLQSSQFETVSAFLVIIHTNAHAHAYTRIQ